MNKDTIKGNWKELKGKLHQKWGKLTNDNIEKMKGSYEELEGALQKQYGYQKDRAEKEIKNFLEDNKIQD